MSIMEETLNNVKVLKGWGGMNVLPEVEERPEDIWMLIKYSDHGDEFLVVGTRDGKVHEYACYVNRKYSEYGQYQRNVRLYKKIDGMSSVSNKIFFEFERGFKKSHMSFGYDRKCYSAEAAQYVFNREMEYISTLVAESDVIIDYDDSKRFIRRWLELNEIATEANLRKLEETKFHNKIGEYRVIGVAGKKEISGHNGIVVDDIEFICINGKKIDPDKILRYHGSDEWGCDSYYLSFKGFRPSR